MIGRLPGWLRPVLSIEVARHWRFLAAQGHDGVVGGETAVVVWVRHRRCDALVWAEAPLLRRPERIAGMSVASLDDAVVALLLEMTPQAAEDLRQVEARTPLRLEEALVMLSLRHPDADLERIVDSLPEDDAQWTVRKAELRASLRTRGFVQRRTVIPRQRLGVTVGSAGRVWVEPYERDGHKVAGYWRRK